MASKTLMTLFVLFVFLGIFGNMFIQRDDTLGKRFDLIPETEMSEHLRSICLGVITEMENTNSQLTPALYLPDECWQEAPPFESYDPASYYIAQSFNKTLFDPIVIDAPFVPSDISIPDWVPFLNGSVSLGWEYPKPFSYLPDDTQASIQDWLIGYSVYPYELVLFILTVFGFAILMGLLNFIRGIS